MHHSYTRIGGVKDDLPRGFIKESHEVLKKVRDKLVDLENLIMGHPQVLEAAAQLRAELAERSWMGVPIRAEVDSRDRKPAEKRWEWIRKGVPVVIELGGRDIEQGVVTMTRRDDETLSRDAVPRDGAVDAVADVLEGIQARLFAEAGKRLRERTRDDITTLEEFREFFSGDDTESGGFVKAPWSEVSETEKTIGDLGVSVRCIPFDETLPADAKCVITGGPAKVVAIFAKAY
jgi:prolyl-tRNA synthetase